MFNQNKNSAKYLIPFWKVGFMIQRRKTKPPEIFYLLKIHIFLASHGLASFITQKGSP